MKFLYIPGWSHFFVWGFLFLSTGCVSEPLRTELAIHHPANPRAPETPFTRPPNPFKSDESMVDLEAGSNGSMPHKGTADSHNQTMNHQMDPKKNSPQPPHAPAAEKAEPGHKEHNH
jgi:hypothetical protein